MAAVIWGLLAKSQTDSEKIEEAIARLILEHNDDEEAHLGAGQSLQSHKASEIIDHLIGSIISDKIAAGEIGREHLDSKAVTFVETIFDKGLLNDFFDFDSSISGSASITKKHRLNRVKTGTIQNSVAKIYTEFCQEGDYWNCPDDIELAINYYFGEDWGWETAPGGEIYFKYGMGLNADMGVDTDKCFGIKFEDTAEGEIKATGFVRSLTNLSTIELATDLQMTDKYVFTITKVGSIFTFYIDGVQKGQITRSISGAVSTPYLTHIAKNPVSGSESEGLISQISYIFEY